ncbi:hypothetical protein G7054_g6664 [Neopestalotiopsis clavispora]|nr:hypothetical protein G7054_g6664 [Neopestalotiopsis clavispora]
MDRATGQRFELGLRLMAVLGFYAVVFAGLVAVIVRWFIIAKTSPLRGIPGPVIAQFTDLWRVVDHWRGTHIETQQRLHEKYGAAVRIGPNVVSLSDDSLLSTVYSTRGNFLKSDHYSVADTSFNGQTVSTIFSTRSNSFHAKKKQPVAKSYSRMMCRSMAMDSVIVTLLMNADECNPVDRFLGKNPLCPFQLPTPQNIVSRCVKMITDRAEDPRDDRSAADMLDRFLEAKREHPDALDDTDIIGYVMNIFAAGSDTSASLEKAAIYYVLRNPEALRKLRVELDAAITSFPPKYRDIRRLPYLNAVIRESLRIHPPVGVLLERVVPSSGLQLQDGRCIPSGTIVGMNAWVLTRNKETFDNDVDTFRPERWLQRNDENGVSYKQRLSRMEKASFSWGGGNRVCIGRNLATVTVCKTIATIFSQYKMELEDAEKPWTLSKSWFVYPKGLRIRASRRDGARY